MKKGWNADRHGCKECIYRNRLKIKNGIYWYQCAYILMMNQSRGCDVEDCTKYVRDKRLRRRKAKDE